MGFLKSLFIYQPTWWGLLRITLLTLVCLNASSSFIEVSKKSPPYGKYFKGTRTVPMSTNDRNWVRDDIIKFPSNETNIAWLSGSSIIIKEGGKVTFLPNLVSQNTSKSTQNYLYNVTARRPIDTYLMVQDAIDKKPDAIVLVLNPFWVYNSSAIFNKDAVFKRAAQLWWNAVDWPKALFLVEPYNYAYNLFGALFPPLLSGEQLYSKLNRVARRSLSVKLKPLPKLAQSNASDKEIKLKQPLQFWLLFKHFDGNVERFFPKGRLDARAWQEATIAIANTDQNALSSRLLNMSFERLRESHIPTLVYLAPISADLSSPLSVNGYSRVKTRLRELRDQYENSSMKIIVDIPVSVTESIKFRDILHLSEPGILPQYLSERINHIIEDVSR